MDLDAPFTTKNIYRNFIVLPNFACAKDQISKKEKRNKISDKKLISLFDSATQFGISIHGRKHHFRKSNCYRRCCSW